MVKHIVMWNFVETLTAEEKREAAVKIKESLENLQAVIPGTLSIQVVTTPLSSSTREIALIGEYEDEEALKAYAGHPEHLKAGAFIKQVCKDRTAFDF
jgi:quinol monooxygenase YgiN